MDDLISSAEAAKILDVTPRAIRWYRDHCGLQAREIAGRLLFLRADVEAFIKPKKTGRPKKKPEAAPVKAKRKPRKKA